MMEAAKIISAKREEFFEMLNQESASLGKINPSMGQFKFIYDPSLLTPKRSQEYLPREIASGTSLIGPHRDDFSFELSGKNLAYFGSRGEQRTAVLELKLAELKFNGRIKKTRPVLLLDDVFSELDSAHREYVISVISDQQTILSAVETENIPQKFLKQVKLVRVEKGEIS
jgi:DNA replication and repair protein RecF